MANTLTPVTTSANAVLPDPVADSYVRGNSSASNYETRTPSQVKADIGAGDMAASSYDPAAISEQLVGLTATQTLTNKTITGGLATADATAALGLATKQQVDAAVGGGYSWAAKTSAYTAVDGDGVLADTSGGAFTVTLPATPADADKIIVADGAAADSWGTNSLTIGRNGSTINGLAADYVCDVDNGWVEFIYDGTNETTWQVRTSFGNASGSGEFVGRATVASATSPDIFGSDNPHINYTGTTTATSFAAATAAGMTRTLFPQSACSFTNSANMICEGGADINAVSGDEVLVESVTTTQFKLWHRRARIFTASYESAQQTITSGAQTLFTHGLGASPKIVQVYLVCQTVEANFAVGDECLVGTVNQGSATDIGCAVVPNHSATQISVTCGSATNAFVVNHKGTGAGTLLTNANWKYIVRAYT